MQHKVNRTNYDASECLTRAYGSIIVFCILKDCNKVDKQQEKKLKVKRQG